MWNSRRVIAGVLASCFIQWLRCVLRLRLLTCVSLLFLLAHLQARVAACQVGDHIKAINGTDLTGCRHFEVARMLKEIPIGAEFSVVLTEPKKAMQEIAPRGAIGGSGNVAAGAGKKTLRMKKDGSAEVVDVDDAVTKMVSKVDDMLESFVGIRDSELSQTIYDLAKGTSEADLFAGQVRYAC